MGRPPSDAGHWLGGGRTRSAARRWCARCEACSRSGRSREGHQTTPLRAVEPPIHGRHAGVQADPRQPVERRACDDRVRTAVGVARVEEPEPGVDVDGPSLPEVQRHHGETLARLVPADLAAPHQRRDHVEVVGRGPTAQYSGTTTAWRARPPSTGLRSTQASGKMPQPSRPATRWRTNGPNTWVTSSPVAARRRGASR
jgi:predicted RNA-binding Zn ribbon-like protein